MTNSMAQQKQETLRGYRYRSGAENQLAPVATAAAWPWLAEAYALSWLLGILPRAARLYFHKLLMRARFFVQRVTLSFDKLAAYSALFPRGKLPDFVADPRGASDAAFAFYRIAAPNPALLQQERDLAALQSRIPFERARIERRFAEHGGCNLEAEAARGRLFAVDHRLVQQALGWQRKRDSRWRAAYLPAPIALFLERPGFHSGCDLVPLAIQIDQRDSGSFNPVYYADEPDPEAWKIAKAFFEVADSNVQDLVVHNGRVHMGLSAFCLATPRRLSAGHPIYQLLRPHLRCMLATAKTAYDDYTDPDDDFAGRFAGTLEIDRNLVTLDATARPFRELAPLRDFAQRGVASEPADYPFRDDALLWLPVIGRFVREYLDATFASDDDVLRDAELQAWAYELMDPQQGNLKGLFEGGRIERKEQLAEVLAQLLFTVGPNHALQHFGSFHYYRFAPIFPPLASRPPLAANETPTPAVFLALLPPIDAALEQFTLDQIGQFRYDRFGDYRRYPLGRFAAAQPAIERLQAGLAEIERVIADRASKRMFRSDFMKPSLVTNSANL